MRDGPLLLVYDICDPKRLRKVEKVMKGFGERVQDSVWECWLDAVLEKRLWAALDKVADAEKDSIRTYPLCACCLKAVTIRGWGTMTRKNGYRVL
jgi:CRISPR-associated protein Cas2